MPPKDVSTHFLLGAEGFESLWTLPTRPPVSPCPPGISACAGGADAPQQHSERVSTQPDSLHQTD